MGFTVALIIVISLLTGILVYFYLKKLQKDEIEAKIRKKADAEQRLADKQAEYANFVGVEKYRTIHNGEVEEYKKGVDAMRQLGILVEQSVVQEKEKDWAIHGGIADGLAGPIAGVAIAIDTMNKNKEIRERNAANREWGRQQKEHYFDMAKKAQQQAPQYISAYEIGRMLAAVYHENCNDLFISNASYRISAETGAVYVKADWKVLNGVRRCVDGAYVAKIYDGSCKLAGYAFLNLPKNGTLDGKGSFEGLCPSPVVKAKYYTIQIEPYNLYEVILAEDKNSVKSDRTFLEQCEHVTRLRQKLDNELAM